MNPSDSSYGRKRIKKPKPGLPQSPEGTAGPVKPEPEKTEKPSKVVLESQPSLDLPLTSNAPAPPPAPEIAIPAETVRKPIPEPEPKPIPKPEPKAEPKTQSRPEAPRGSLAEKPQARREGRDARPTRDNRRPEGYRQSQSAPPPSERKKEERPPYPKPQARPHRFGGERGKVRVSIIIPAYNEEGNIKPLMDQFHEVIARAGNDWEVILVDDGSTDKTAERARDASIHYHWLRVVSYPVNRGLTDALNTGFQHAKGSVYVFYPADLQYHPQDIPKMITRIDRGADVVTGWKQGKYQKRLVSFVYNYICRALFNIKVHDLNSVKAFKKEVLEKVNLRHDWHRYLVVLAADQGFIVDEVKVNVYPRHSGKSKFGTGRILGGVLDLLSVKFQISFTKKPLRFFGTWGLLSILLGLLTGLIAIYLRFFTPYGSRVWLYLVILFVLSGLMLFSLGFLAEVIVALREEIESLKSKK